MRRGNKITGFSVSSQFKEQLQKLMEHLNDSAPQYVRCIKPNSTAGARVAEDALITQQLRAGSILEAIRIRKIGYGYRMEYEDFADKYWPLVGERVYETDHQVVKMIFEKAAEYVDSEKRELMMDGEQAGWRCGQTKLFMKDQARYAIESALNGLLGHQATKI